MISVDLMIAITGLSEGIIKSSNIGVWLNNRIHFQRDYTLYEEIKKLNTRNIDFVVRDKVIDTDELLYVLAEEFHRIEQKKEYDEWNNAILMFLYRIPRDTVVILYWY